MVKDRKLVLIDGHSILHRAFYGVPDLTNAKGLHTNAVYGFLNIMFRILEEEKPDFLAVAFDVHAPTFRHEMYEAYKGTRKPMPEELREQVPVLKDVLRAMQVTIVEQAGLEADDILGTLAKKAQAQGMEVSLVSGDRDLLQVADEHIKIRIPKTKMGRTEVEDYYPEDVVKAFQVTPHQFIDLKALMGDSSDNVPGVPKVGQKTATELMVQYGSMEEIYAHVEEISKKSIRESLIANRELADLSKVLVTIRTDSDVSMDYEASKAEGFYTKEAYDLFKELEFRNMLSRFRQDQADANEDIAATFRRLESLEDFLGRLKKIKDSQRVGLFLAMEGDCPVAAAVSAQEETFLYVLPREENVQLSLFEEPGQNRGREGEEAACAEGLRALSARARIASFDIKRLYPYLEQDTTERYFDILIGAYLLNPLKNDHAPETIAAEHLGLQIPGWAERFGKQKAGEAVREAPDRFMEYCCYGAYVARKAADVLEKLSEEAPIVKDILEYRQLTKLKSTYADGLAVYIGEDRRIHTSFNQTITATGRISSTEPNLQNIPMRMELGRRIRKVFVPREGCEFMDADYSQIELRVLAHMSGDEQLIEAYHMDQDIHRITAAKVFHTPFEEVTDLQRRNAKAVNFGIVYGISSFGLSQDLSISKKEAADYIEQYFATYPGVKAFLDGLVAGAKEKGYITTMFGRRRPVPELSSSNFMQRSFGERVAMNSPIQGTAADIIKIAMIRVWQALRDSGLKSRLILQVHDELVIETYREEEEQVRQILLENMQGAAELDVALEVDLHTGDNWYEAK